MFKIASFSHNYVVCQSWYEKQVFGGLHQPGNTLASQNWSNIPRAISVRKLHRESRATLDDVHNKSIRVMHAEHSCVHDNCQKVNNVDSRVDRQGLLTSTAIMHKLHKLIAHNTRPTECTVQSMIICTLWPLRGQLSMFRKGNSSSRINFWKYRLWCCITTKYFFYLRGTVVSIDETKENKQYQPAQRFHFIFLTRKFRIIYDFFFRLLHLSSSRSLLGWVHHARPPEGSDRFITSKKRTLWNNKFQHN